MLNKSILLVVGLGFLNLTTAGPIGWKDPVKEHGKEPLGLQAYSAIVPPQQIDDSLINLVAALNAQHNTSPSVDITATDAGFFNAKMSTEPIFTDRHIYIVRAGFGGITCGKQKGSCKRSGGMETGDFVGNVYQGGCYGSRCCGGVEGSCFDKVNQEQVELEELMEKYTPKPGCHNWDDCGLD